MKVEIIKYDRFGGMPHFGITYTDAEGQKKHGWIPCDLVLPLSCEVYRKGDMLKGEDRPPVPSRHPPTREEGACQPQE